MSMHWVNRVRLKLAVVIIGVPLAALGAISIGPSWLALPIIGATMYALSVAVNKTSTSLTKARCWSCGHDLSTQTPDGEYGVACPHCGTFNQHIPLTLEETTLASDDDASGEDDERATA